MHKSTTGNHSIQDIFHLLVILAISKLLKTCGIYICYDLIKFVYIVPLLFLIYAFNSLTFLAIQRLFGNNKSQAKPKTIGSILPNGPKMDLNKYQWLRVVKYSVVMVLIRLFWLYGLTLCGPLRTIFIFEHSEFVVISLAKSLVLSQTSPSRSRGALLLVMGFFILLAFDHDDLREKLNEQHHPEGRNHGLLSHIFLTWFKLSDHKGGVVLLAASLLLEVGFNSATRPLINEVGGTIRLKHVSSYVSCALLAPFFLFYMFGYGVFVKTTIKMSDDPSSTAFYYVLCIATASLFVFIVDAYVDVYVTNKTSVQIKSKYGTWFIFSFAIIFTYIWTTNNPYTVVIKDKLKTIVTQEHIVSYGVLFAFVLFMVATELLSSTATTTTGNLIGYNTAGHPIYTLTGETIKRKSLTAYALCTNMFKEILTHSDSRSIFYFLCINLAFTFVELLFGVWTNSLGLISDGFHMLFDCSALVMGLCAAVISQWKPTRVYSYGYGRIEVLSGFVNALFLIVIAIFVFVEGVGRLFQPPDIKTDRLMIVSVGGLVVNMIGIFAFRHAHTHGGVACTHESTTSNMSANKHSNQHHHHHHGHSHDTSSTINTDNDNMRGVFLHILADTLSSAGLIVSSFLVEQFGWLIADPICSIFISIMIIVSVVPLIRHSTMILLLRTPVDKEKCLQVMCKKIMDMTGVKSLRNVHMWQLATSSYVTTVHVQLDDRTYEQIVMAQVESLLKENRIANLTVQIEKDAYYQHLAGLGNSVPTPIHMHNSMISDKNTLFYKV